MRVLVWHVHGAWTTAFVQGRHDYLVPVDDERSPAGRGRALTYDWPDSAVEVHVEQLRDVRPDVVVLQRPEDLDDARRLLGIEPGVEVAAVCVEHNTPRGDVGGARHWLADRPDIPVVHVTPFNATFWDCGRAPVTVVEHGVVDPGPLWTGEHETASVVVNEPVRRGRIVGTDLLPRFAQAAPLDVFGMKVHGLAAHLGLGEDLLREHDDVPQSLLHPLMAETRLYLHPVRWTSLGLSLVEAMHVGMPVVALAATAVPDAVPDDVGVVSTDVDVLVDAVRELVKDHALAQRLGDRARAHALSRFGLGRFLADWDRVLEEVA